MAIVAAGVRELRGSRVLRGAVLFVPAVVTVWGSLDEYLPLLAAENGAAPQHVPLLALVVYGGMAVGGVLAGRTARLRGRGMALMLAAAAALLAAGALCAPPPGSPRSPSPSRFQAVTVVVDARLQPAIEGRARSTVTSLAGLLTEVATIATFTAYAAGSAVRRTRCCSGSVRPPTCSSRPSPPGSSTPSGEHRGAGDRIHPVGGVAPPAPRG